MSAADRFDELAEAADECETFSCPCGEKFTTIEAYDAHRVVARAEDVRRARARHTERLTAPCTCRPNGERPIGADVDVCPRNIECWNAWLGRQAPSRSTSGQVDEWAREAQRGFADLVEVNLTREIHRTENEDPGPNNPGVALGLRRARAIVRKARP